MRMNSLWRRIAWLRHRHAIEHGLDEEIRFHIDQQTEKNVRAGMDPVEARRLAFIRFGGVEHVKASARDEVRPVLLEDLVADVRYGGRALRRAPGFTLICVITLASSIGAATVVFSIVNGVVIKPLPYPESEALVSIWNSSRSESSDLIPVSATQFFTFREQNQVFAMLGLWSSGRASVTGMAEPEEVSALRVSDGTLQALGVAPERGRWFRSADDSPGSPDTVILTHPYWQRRFGGDPTMIGRTLVVDARPRTVIGVMPPQFRFLTATPDLILPLQIDRRGLVLGSFNYSALARLKPGVTLIEAHADISRMMPIWLHAWPAPPGFDPDWWNLTPTLRPLKHDVVGHVAGVLWLLMGTIALVVLIACANIANLLLVRSARRERELALRAALGAGRSRIARSLVVESVLLALLGGTLGVSLSHGLLPIIVALAPANVPRLAEVTIDPVVLSFAFVVSLASSVLFGVIPARRQLPRVSVLLRTGDATAADSRERHRARHMLVVAQVSMALVLLVGSGLMVRTLLALRAVHPGFSQPNEVQLVRITIPATLIDDPERVFRMQRDIRDQIAAIPGVAAVAFTSAAPLEPYVSVNTILSEETTPAEGKSRRFKFVSPGYFATVGTSLVAGRDFTWSDLQQRRPVVVISERLAREMWGDPAAAIGRRIRENRLAPWREIVGVVRDVFDDGVHVPAPATAYWPAVLDNFEGVRIRVRRSMTFVIRSARAGSDALLADAQAAVWTVNPNLPLAQVQTLRQIYERSLARTSFTVAVLAIAASVAVLLGLVGVYGVISAMVTQRTREIGIRIALGAQRGELKWQFVRRGVGLASVGIVLGLGAALGATRLMSSFLFGISPLDPLTYGAVAAALVTAAALASYMPAHRATTRSATRLLRTDG